MTYLSAKTFCNTFSSTPTVSRNTFTVRSGQSSALLPQVRQGLWHLESDEASACRKELEAFSPLDYSSFRLPFPLITCFTKDSFSCCFLLLFSVCIESVLLGHLATWRISCLLTSVEATFPVRRIWSGPLW